MKLNKEKAATKIKNNWTILKESGIHFMDSNPVELAGTTSYFAIFSIAPVLIIIISIFGFIVGDETIKYKLFNELDGLIGSESSLTLKKAIENYSIEKDSTAGTIIGIVFFLISATTLFSAMQNSINFIWRVKVKSNLKMGLLKMLKDRLFSFGVIFSMGFVLLISLIVDVLITSLKDLMSSYFNPDFVTLAQMINLGVSFAVIIGIFGLIYRFLPDVNVRWSASFYGAFITAILFSGGKFLIGFILNSSNLGVVYGAASSFIGILVWIFYASLIFYFGVEITRQYSMFYKHDNKPASFAIPFKIDPVEKKELNKD